MKLPMNFSEISKTISQWFVIETSSNEVPIFSVDLQSLEERVLYSAAPLPIDLADGADILASEVDNSPNGQLSLEDLQLAVDALESLEQTATIGDLSDLTMLDDSLNTTNELIVIDQSVPAYEILVDDILEQSVPGRSIEFLYINSSTDGVKQLSNYFEVSDREYDAVHLISHGSNGALQLGNTILNSSNLTNFESEFQTWQSSLTDDADLLIYGCEIALNESGENFVNELSELTGTDVAASDDLTGHDSLGGDWEFEFFAGSVDAELIFSNEILSSWNDTLILYDGTSEGSSTYESSGGNLPLDGTTNSIGADYFGNLVYVVSTDDAGIASDGADVFLQRVSADGTPSALIQVNNIGTNDAGDQKWASVAVADNGNHVVTWTTEDAGSFSVWASVYRADGTLIKDDFQVDVSASGGNDAEVAIDNNGNFVIVWEASDGDHDGIFAQKFDALGNTDGFTFQVNSDNVGNQGNASVAINDAGDVLIAWDTFDPGDPNIESEVHAFKSFGDGSTDLEWTVGSSTEVKYTMPAVDMDSIGRYVIVYTVDGTESLKTADGGIADAIAAGTANNLQTGIGAKTYAADGSEIDSMLFDLINDDHQYSPNVSLFEDGTFMYVYEGKGPDGAGGNDDEGVFRQFFDLNGSEVDGRAPLIADAVSGIQKSGAVATFRGGTEYVAGLTGFSSETGSPVDGYHWVRSDTFTDVLPTSGDETLSTTEDSPLQLLETNFAYSDSDIAAGSDQEFTGISIDSLPTDGTLTVDGSRVNDGDFIGLKDIQDGKLYFIPNSDFSGSTSFNFFVHNENQQSASSNTISINVSPVLDDGLLVGGTELVTVNGAELVNETISGDQAAYRTTSLEDGGHVVVWHGESGGENKIFAKVYDANGNTTVVQHRVDVDNAGYQTYPDVTSLNGGGFVVTWTQETATVSDVYGQIYDNSGAQVGGDFLLSENSSFRQNGTRVEALKDGGFVVAWASAAIDSNMQGISARVFDATGTGGTEFLVNNTIETGSQHEVELVVLDDNNVFFSWIDQSSGDSDIRGRVVDLYDPTLGSELGFTINSTTAGDQTAHAMARNADGAVVVVWESQNNDDGSGIGVFARVFDSNMSTSGPDIQLNQETLLHQEEPTVIALADGGFMAFWESDSNDADGKAIVGRRFQADLTPVGDEFTVNENVYGNQLAPEAIQLTSGEVIVIYGSADGDNEGADFGQGLFQNRMNFAAVGNEDTSIALNIGYGSSDASEILKSLVIGGVPTGVAITDGVTTVAADGAGEVDVIASGLTIANLALVPASDSYQDFDLTLSSTFEESDSSTSPVKTQTLKIVVLATDDDFTNSGLSDTIDEDQTTSFLSSNLSSGYSDVDRTTIGKTPAVALSQADVVSTQNGSSQYVWGNGGHEIYLEGSGVNYVADSGSSIQGLNNVYEFNGTDGGRATQSVLDDFRAEGTLELWIKPSDLTGKKIILDNSIASKGFVVYQQDDSIVVEVYQAQQLEGNDVEPIHLIAGGLQTGEFNLITLSYDMVSIERTISLMLDGHLKDKVTNPHQIQANYDIRTASDSGVGKFFSDTFVDTAGFSNFTGQIGQISVFDEALSTSEAEARFLNEINVGEVVSINGQPYASETTVNLPSGAIVTIDENGDLQYDPNGAFDYLTSGSSDQDVFQYEMTNGAGQSELIDVVVTINGVATGAPSDLSTGIGINTDGGNDVYFGTQNTSFLDGVGDFTFEMSFASSNDVAMPLVSYKLANGGTDEFELLYQGDGTIRFETEDGDGDSAANTLNGFDYSTLFDGNRHTFSFSFDTSKGEWKVYVDGVEVEKEKDSNIEDITFTGGGSLVFGQEQDSPNGDFDSAEHFQGTIYDVRIWDRKTSGNQADDYLNRQISPLDVPADIIANWQFNSLVGGNSITNIVDAGNPLVLGHATGTGFTTSTPATELSLPVTATNGTIVGSVVPTDGDSNETFTYSLTDDANGLFTISNQGQITVADSNLIANGVETIEIEVTDSNSHTYTEIFQIAVGDVDSPYIENLNTLSVSEGSSGNLIQNTHLQVLDHSDAPVDLEYTLNSVPLNGELRLNGTPLALNDTFTQEDIDLDRLSYDHDGNQSTTESFDFTVSDGSLNVSGTFTLSIGLVNDPITKLSSGVELNVDGDDAYFVANNGHALFGSVDQFTYEVSFSSVNVGELNVLASYHEVTAANADDDAFRLNLTAAGELAIVINGSVQRSSSYDYSQLLDGSLHSIAVAWDSSQGYWQVHVDGALVDSGNGFATGQDIRDNGTFVLGHEQDSVDGGYDTTNEFKGTLHDVRLWSQVKSTEEIAGNANIKFDAATVPTGLIANWQFDDLAGGTTIVDIVTGNDLTLQRITDVGFTGATVDNQLDIDENSANGTIVGHVVPTDSEFVEDLVFDGSFTSPDEPSNTSFQEYTAGEFLGEWEVLSNGVDLRGSSWESSPLGGRGVDLTGDSGQGSIGQTIPTISGQTYELTFALSGNFEGSETTQTLDVLIDGVATSFSIDEPSGWSRSNLQWETRTLTFTADSSSTNIVLEGTSGFRRGAIISDVAIVASHSPDHSANVFTLLDNAGDRFAIDSTTGEITVLDSTQLNFETDASHTIQIRVMDEDSQDRIETLTINVNDVNEVPGVNMTPITVDEGSSGNVINGVNLTETDPDDSGSELTYELVGNVDHGTLRLDLTTVLGLNDTFTQADIDAGRLSYDHDGTETSADSFDFTISDGGEDGVTPQAFSFTINIDAVNDAPTLTAGDFSMVDVVVNNINPSGETVATILASSSGNPIEDQDAGDILGMAVIGVDNTNGDWQYSLNDGSTWASFSSVGVSTSGTDETNALALDETVRIRFVPVMGYTGSAGDLTFRAWDQSDTTLSGATVDATFAGNAGAFSSGTETVTLNVFAGSGIENTVPSATTTSFEVPVVFSTATGNAISVSDTNADDTHLRVTIGVTDGTLNINSSATGITFVHGTTDGSDTISIYGLESALNVALDGLTFTPNAGFDGVVSLDVTTDIEFGQIVGFTDTSPDAASNVVVNDPERGNVVEFGPGEFAQLTSGGSATRLGEPSSITLAGWVNVAPTGTDGDFFSLADSVVIRVDSSAHGNSVAGFFYDGTSDLATTSSQAFAGTGWHHVAYTIDEATSTQKLYIDGTLVGTTNHSGPINYQNFGTYVGVNASNGANDFEGRVDDIYVFNRAISEAEVLAMREEGLSDSDSVSITVNPNVAPSALDNIYGVEVGGSLSIGVDRGLLYNDSDSDGHGLTVSQILSGPSNGSLIFQTDGSFTYTQDGPIAASDSFTYEVSDGNGGLSTAVAYIHIDTDGLVASSEFAVNTESSVAPDESSGHPLSASQSLDQFSRPSNSSVAINDSGDYVIVWTSAGTDGTSNVLMRVFDFSGTPLTDQTVVYAEDGVANAGASVAMGPNGEFVIAWERGNSSQDVVFQRYDAVGNKVGSLQSIAQDPDTSMAEDYLFGAQSNPSVQFNGNGDLVVLWDGAYERANGTTVQHDVYLQRFLADGTIEDVIRIATPTGGFEFNSNAVYFDNGDIFVTWDDNDGIPGTVVAADGTIGTSFFVEELGSSANVQRSSIATNQSGLVAIAYEREAPDGTWSSLVKIIDPYNPVVGTEFEGPQSTTGDQANVDVDFTDDGNILLTWSGQSTTDGADTHDVFARRLQVVDLGGSYGVEALGDEIVVSSSTGKQNNASVAAIDSENFVVVWDGNGFGDTNGVFARQYGNQTDLVSLSGEVFEDIAGDGQHDTGDLGVEKAVVKLYRDDGDGIANDTDILVRTVETDGTGGYSFTGLKSTKTYWVVVDSKTITPLAGINAGFAVDSFWAQQTYGDGGIEYGGLDAGVSDDASNLSTAQHRSVVDFNVDSGLGVNFGFSFNVVTNTLAGDAQDDSGDNADTRSVQGSLRQFIDNANAIAAGNHMRFVPVVTSTEQLASDEWWEIAVSVALPAITDADTTIDGTSHNYLTGLEQNSNSATLGQSTHVGTGPEGADGVAGNGDELSGDWDAYWLDGVDAPDLEIHDISGVDNGLVVDAANVEIAYLSIHGFGNSTDDANILVLERGDFVFIHDNVLGSEAHTFTQGPTATSSEHNILVIEADDGDIVGNLIGFAGGTGIKFGESLVDNATNWDVVGNEIRGNGHERGGQDGIDVVSATDIRITTNLISDNVGFGVDTFNNPGGVTIADNTISSNGSVGSERGGVRIFSDGNTVEHNVITDNLGSGVVVMGDSAHLTYTFDQATGNLISQNSFSGNAGTAIDLVAASAAMSDVAGGDNVSANGVADDANAGNAGLDYPELKEVSLVTGGLRIAALIDPTLSIDRIEVYVASAGTGDDWNGSSYGEGQTYIGTINNVQTLLGAVTPGRLSTILLEPAGGWPVALTENTEVSVVAIDTSNNTSEFSENVNVNILPVANSSSVTFDEDTTHTFSSSEFGFSDTPLDTLTKIRIDSLPTNGSLTLFNIATSTDVPVNVGDEITAAMIDANRLKFTPDLNEFGTPLTDFQFSVQDAISFSQSPATMSLNVTQVNDDPTGTGVALTTGEDVPLVITPSELTQNISDIEGDTLTPSIFSGPSEGALTLQGDGTFLYEPNTDFEGIDSFMYEVSDGNGGMILVQATITVSSFNDAPVMDDPGSLTFDENSTAAVTTLTGSDADGDSLSFQIAGTGIDDGYFQIVGDELRFIDTPDFENPEAFSGNTYYVDVLPFDGTDVGNTLTVQVTVLNVNDAPVAMDDSWTIDEAENYLSTFSVLDNDLDPLGSGLTASVVTTTTNGSLVLNPDGTFDYEHDGSETTMDSFVYEVTSADGQTDSATFTFNIDAVQDPTQVRDDGAYGVDADEFIIVSKETLLANDSDPDSTEFNLVIVEPPARGEAFIDSNGNLFFNPDVTFSGVEKLEYVVVADGVTSERATVFFVVSAPPASQTSSESTEETINESEVEPTTEIVGEDPSQESTVDTIANAEEELAVDRSAISDFGADTFEASSAELESSIDGLFLTSDNYHTTYSFASDNGDSVSELATTFVRVVSNQAGVSTFDPVMIGMIWNEMDSAKKEYLMNLEFNAPSIAASVTSFLTVGYLAWIIRGGVLLTTFMSSVPAWQSFDPLPVIESANREDDEHDESIQQMVDA